MKLGRILLLAALFTLLPFTLKVFGNDFGSSQSLFTNIKARAVGDNLTVLIFELTDASNQSVSKNEENVDAKVSGGPGSGPLDFIPLFGVSTISEHAYDGKARLTKKQSLRAKMTVTVVGVKNNGDLIIKGSRIVGVGNNTETMTLTGVVRSRDVKTDNTVDSYLIADARITYDGEGPAQNLNKPGIISRLLGWLF